MTKIKKYHETSFMDDNEPVTFHPQQHKGSSTLTLLFQERCKALIDLADDMRTCGVEDIGINLPSIVVVGDQSSGKSSVMQCISQISLPKNDGMTTRMPLEMRLKQQACPWRATLFYTDQSGLNKKIEITQPEDVGKAVEKAQTESCANHDVSSQELVLEVQGSNLPNLTLIDLPGVIATEKKSLCEGAKQKILTITNKYMTRDNTIILLVLAADRDFDTNDIIEEHKKVDPRGERTIAVVTKVDVIDMTRIKLILKEFQTNEYHFFEHFFVVSRFENDSDEAIISVLEKARREQAFFSTHPELKHLQEICGIQNLTLRLIERLAQSIQRYLCPMQGKIRESLQKSRDHYAKLQVEIGDSDSQRSAYIATMVQKFCDKMTRALDVGFDEYPSFYGIEEELSMASSERREDESLEQLSAEMLSSKVDPSYYHLPVPFLAELFHEMADKYCIEPKTVDDLVRTVQGYNTAHQQAATSGAGSSTMTTHRKTSNMAHMHPSCSSPALRGSEEAHANGSEAGRNKPSLLFIWSRTFKRYSNEIRTSSNHKCFDENGPLSEANVKEFLFKRMAYMPPEFDNIYALKSLLKEFGYKNISMDCLNRIDMQLEVFSESLVDRTFQGAHPSLINFVKTIVLDQRIKSYSKTQSRIIDQLKLSKQFFVQNVLYENKYSEMVNDSKAKNSHSSDKKRLFRDLFNLCMKSLSADQPKAQFFSELGSWFMESGKPKNIQKSNISKQSREEKFMNTIKTCIELMNSHLEFSVPACIRSTLHIEFAKNLKKAFIEEIHKGNILNEICFEDTNYQERQDLEMKIKSLEKCQKLLADFKPAGRGI